MRRLTSGIASVAASVVALSLTVAIVFSLPASAQSMSGNPALPTYNSALPSQQGMPQQPQQNLAATAPSAPSTQSFQSDPGYRLGNGDQVRITVFGQPDLTNTYQIDGTGMLAFPLIGRIHAGGMTAAELQSEIVHKLSPDYIRNPSVSVEVNNYRPFFILGEVNKAGAYPYVSGMTVLTAVAFAGGFTYRAKDDNFEINRTENGQHSEIKANRDTPVRPGDVITIPERFF